MKEVFALNSGQTLPQAGEIWLAKFSFEEGGSYKVRPVLVLESRPYGCKAAFVGTQKLDSTSSRCDVLLDDEQAQAIGLQRASRLCFDNHRVLSPADLLRPRSESWAHLGKTCPPVSSGKWLRPYRPLAFSDLSQS